MSNRADGQPAWKDNPKPDYLLTETMLSRYLFLHQQTKKMEKELAGLKEQIHSFFDQTCGPMKKGSQQVGSYFVQRQIRTAESYDEKKTVKLLEELQLEDCIQIVRKPDSQKIEAALTLGLLAEEDLKECRLKKEMQAIVVREHS